MKELSKEMQNMVDRVAALEDSLKAMKLTEEKNLRAKAKKGIAIKAKGRAGKDTFADELERTVLPEYLGTRYALADPIRELIHLLFNVSDTVAATQKDIELRYLVTMESFDNFTETFLLLFEDYPEFTVEGVWSFLIPMFTFDPIQSGYAYKGTLRHMYQQLGTEYGRSVRPTIWLEQAPEFSLITDLRFDDEIQFFKDKGYLIVGIERDTSEYTVSASTHSSESGTTIVPDVTINNDGTLDYYLNTEIARFTQLVFGE